MSVFDETPEIKADTLVGEGKKYKTADELAKAYANADEFIEKLKADNARLAAEKALAESRREAPVTPPTPPAPNPEPKESKPSFSEDDLAARIREELTRNQTEQVQRTNLEQAVSAVVAHAGSDDAANALIRSKASELGVSVDFLKSTAATSPKGFLKLIGLEAEAAPARGTPAHRNEVNPAALGPSTGTAPKPGTWAYFEKIRKDAPGRYFSAQVQRELMQARQSMDPEQFYAKS